MVDLCNLYFLLLLSLCKFYWGKDLHAILGRGNPGRMIILFGTRDEQPPHLNLKSKPRVLLPGSIVGTSTIQTSDGAARDCIHSPSVCNLHGPLPKNRGMFLSTIAVGRSTRNNFQTPSFATESTYRGERTPGIESATFGAHLFLLNPLAGFIRVRQFKHGRTQKRKERSKYELEYDDCREAKKKTVRPRVSRQQFSHPGFHLSRGDSKTPQRPKVPRM